MTVQQKLEREVKRHKNIQLRQQQMNLSEAQEYLTNGASFLKYGKRGRPKPRHIFLIDKAISWREPGSKATPLPKDQKKFIRYMPILDIKDITYGRGSDIFKRFQIKKESEKYREQLSVTIHGGKRTLDLEASTASELEQFIQMLTIVRDFIVQEERINQGKAAIEEGQNYMQIAKVQSTSAIAPPD